MTSEELTNLERRPTMALTYEKIKAFLMDECRMEQLLSGDLKIVFPGDNNVICLDRDLIRAAEKHTEKMLSWTIASLDHLLNGADCIEILAERQSGKSTFLKSLAINTCLNKPGSRVACVGYPREAKRIFWSGGDGFVGVNRKDCLGATINNQEMSMAFCNGSRLQVVELESLLKLWDAGVRFDLILFDEVDFPRDQFRGATMVFAGTRKKTQNA